MKIFLMSILASATFNAAALARDCAKVAGSVAKSVDAISNEQSENSLKVSFSQKINTKPHGGETLDTYSVGLIADEDMSAAYEVKLFSAQCIIQNVRFISGE